MINSVKSNNVETKVKGKLIQFGHTYNDAPKVQYAEMRISVIN